MPVNPWVFRSWNRPHVTRWARPSAYARASALRRVPMVGEFLDVMREAEQLPLRIDHCAAAQWCLREFACSRLPEFGCSSTNGTPFSEELFRTFTYCPAYPSRPFADLPAAAAWVADFVQCCSHEHHHCAIRRVTPAARQTGREGAILAQRQRVLHVRDGRIPNAGVARHAIGRR